MTGRAGWMGGLVLMLSACAHDPAPKARCHGPWVWLTPAGGSSAGPADSALSKRRSSRRSVGPSSVDVPAAGPR